MKFGQTVECDMCGADITADGNYTMSKDKKKVGGDVILIESIVCPRCGAKFPYIVTDKATRKMIRARKAYIQRILTTMEHEHRPATDPKIAKMLEENRRLGREIEAKVSALKDKYLRDGGKKHGKK